MALTKNARRGGATTGNKRTNTMPRRTQAEYEALQAAKQEAERRERILEDRRRTDAKWRPKIAEVRKVTNFEAFKNRFHDLREPDYAVEVLYGTPNLQAQIRREQTARRKEELARDRQKWASYYYTSAASDYAFEPSSSYAKKTIEDGKLSKSDKKLAVDEGQLQDAVMQRVRIQSQAVLGHLTSLMNETERRSTPRTFLRPFKPLIYFQPKMKEILATLEEKWGDVESLEDVRSEASVATPDEMDEPVVKITVPTKEGDEASQSGDDEDEEDKESLRSVDSNAEDQELLLDSVEALRDMRCYVNFVENDVMPLFTQYEGTMATHVRFDDLWSLFRVGDLIHMPASNESAARYHEMWRVYRVRSPEPDSKSISKRQHTRARANS